MSLSQRNASRPSSSASLRPSSSASIRPSSSSSLRPPSSASYRPPSSASTRTASRLSHRPVSRHSRPSTRPSAARLLSLCQALVTQVTGITTEDDEHNFRTASEFVSKNVEYASKAAVGLDMAAVGKQIRGHVEKARITSNDEVADALEASHKQLKAHLKLVERERDLDQEIKISHLPDHLQLLFLLSLPPTASTTTYASTYLDRMRNPPPPQQSLTWAEILAEEPFEGQHWEGAYGLPPGSTREGWEMHSGGSTPSLSPLDDFSDEFDDEVERLDPPKPQETVVPPQQTRAQDTGKIERDYSYRREFEELQARQYWRAGWRTSTPLSRPFDIGDPSTLGPSVRRVLGESKTPSIDPQEHERYIYEHDAVREILMALQGRSNILLASSNHPPAFALSRTAPRLAHYTLISQASLLTSFAATATTLARLRAFTSAVFLHARCIQTPVRPREQDTRTLEAFADAVDREVRTLERWCATREEAFCRAQAGEGEPLVISLLSLEKAVRDSFAGAFDALLDMLPGGSQRHSPARLLDALLRAAHTYRSMGAHITASILMRVFARTAEPVWAMVGRWLHSGTVADGEFFVEDNELALVDPDFWMEGYALREGMGDEETVGMETVPEFLRHVAGLVLGAGKAVGLLRAMGVPPAVDDQGGDRSSEWRPFSALLTTAEAEDDLGLVSDDTLSQLVYDELQPRCAVMGLSLTAVLVDDCGLWRHLSAIEDLYLMQRGDAMSNFADILFAKMDTPQSWSDFHFLNSAFGDVVDTGATPWIETALVRLSYRKSTRDRDRDKTIGRTVKALDGLLVEYAVPFPLTYVCGPRALQAYGAVFVLLLQIRRAKSVLERILVRGGVGAVGGELKAFYAMRSKLWWFVNILLNFLTTYVIHTQVLGFHDALRKAKSLDEMIQLHDEHLEKIQSRCLLRPNTAALYRAILSILDMSIHFSDCFVAFAGETATHDISRQSVSMRRHRSRRQRRQRRNVIGFSQSLHESLDTSEDDSDLDRDSAHEPSFSLAVSSVSIDDDLGSFHRLDQMSTELDGLVRFVRRGVESLAGGAGEAAPAFGIFAFALEDWDI